MSRIYGYAFLIAFELVGYGLLIWADWRVALGVFLIHWSVNVKHRRGL